MNVTEQLHRAIHAGLLEEVKRFVKEGAQLDLVLGMRGTALCAAIEARNLAITEFLLKAGCNVNTQDYDGEPPLLLAIRKDSPGQIMGKKPCLDIIKLLIDHPKCNLSKIDPLTKKSALHFATEQEMVQVIRWILSSKSKCDINAVDTNGNTPLHLAAYDGHHSVVEELVSSPDCCIKVYNRAGLTPLHISANIGDKDSLKILLKRLSKTDRTCNEFDKDADENSILDVNVNAVTIFEKETCLHLAARNGSAEIVKILLDYGAVVNVRNNLDNTPLLLSILSVPVWQTKNIDIPNMLLKKGATMNNKSAVRSRYVVRDAVVSPLILAAMNDNIELARSLIKHGADVNLCDDYGRAPLYVALWENSYNVANFLLNQCPEINVNLCTFESLTPLHAVFKCFNRDNPEITCDLTRGLLRAGAQILPDREGKTPIDMVFEYENASVLDVLLEETKTSVDKVREGIGHINQYLKEEEEYSLISKAVAQGLTDIVKVLLFHGANIDERTAENESLLYIAIYNSEDKIARFLVENGCDLKNETYVFAEPLKKREEIVSKVNDSDDEGSEDDSDDWDSGDSDDADLFAGNEKLRSWIQEVAGSPKSLKLTCMMNIRNFYRQNGIPFWKVNELPLPSKLKNNIRYRES